jgi:hypothetical protein
LGDAFTPDHLLQGFDNVGVTVEFLQRPKLAPIADHPPTIYYPSPLLSRDRRERSQLWSHSYDGSVPRVCPHADAWRLSIGQHAGVSVSVEPPCVSMRARSDRPY